MIKYIIGLMGIVSFSALASSTLGSTANIPDVEGQSKQGFHGQVGIGVASVPEYIGSSDNEGKGVPLINVSYNDTYYFRYNKLGAWLLKSDSGFRLGGVVTIHQGYDKGDGDLLTEDRDDSIMAGVNAGYKNGRFSVEAGIVTDVSDNADGEKLYAQMGYTFMAESNYSITGIAKVESLDKDVVEFYYKNPESSTNFSVGIVGTYKLTKRWTLMGAVSANSLGDEIGDSPIVEDDSYSSALIGATYSF